MFRCVHNHICPSRSHISAEGHSPSDRLIKKMLVVPTPRLAEKESLPRMGGCWFLTDIDLVCKWKEFSLTSKSPVIEDDWEHAFFPCFNIMPSSKLSPEWWPLLLSGRLGLECLDSPSSKPVSWAQVDPWRGLNQLLFTPRLNFDEVWTVHRKIVSLTLFLSFISY